VDFLSLQRKIYVTVLEIYLSLMNIYEGREARKKISRDFKNAKKNYLNKNNYAGEKI
jgi:hypothetical protein